MAQIQAHAAVSRAFDGSSISMPPEIALVLNWLNSYFRTRNMRQTNEQGAGSGYRKTCIHPRAITPSPSTTASSPKWRPDCAAASTITASRLQHPNWWWQAWMTAIGWFQLIWTFPSPFLRIPLCNTEMSGFAHERKQWERRFRGIEYQPARVRHLQLPFAPCLAQ